MTQENAIKISGAIITSFINLHYLEEVKKLGVVKHAAKNNLNKTLTNLKEIETQYFNEVEKVDENELADKLTANTLIFVNWLLKEFNFDEFSKFQEIVGAYKLSPKRITGISDKILIENGAKK